MTVYKIAIAAYERAIAVFANRAGVSADLLAPTLSDTLALPGERTEETDDMRALVSIVGRLSLATNPSNVQPVTERRPHYFRPLSISLSDWQQLDASMVLPYEKVPEGLDADYRHCWRGFDSERQRLVTDQQSDLVREANLWALMQRFCWSMPAPPVRQPDGRLVDDVSLFDYARVSAALAVCLEGREAVADDEPVGLLVGGDLSGVQDWLYTLSSSGAAQNLRGRSFYLQLLCEVIALYLLRELELPTCNLLYMGGGNFYLLAPLRCAEVLQRLQPKISAKLLTMHEGALYVALGQAEVKAAALRNGLIGEVWHQVTQSLQQVKRRRFAELDEALMAIAIGAAQPGHGDPLNTCAICRSVISLGKRSDNDSPICGLCDSFKKLGNRLREAEFLVIADIAERDAGRVNNWQAGLQQFGYDVQLVWASGRDKSAAWQDTAAPLVRIYFWQDERPAIEAFPGNPAHEQTVWAFRPLAQCVPVNGEGEIADFEEIANASEGVKHWGVLRMDVDNLGSLFQRGIPGGNLCRVVSLSGLLRLFFEGHVPALAEAINEGRKHPRLYLMYAGGDDLFVVGAWSYLPQLAADIRKDVAAFAGDNPEVTISGGITIALADKYPLYQAASDAGIVEHLAKDLPGKDGLAFLGEPIKWDVYPQVANRVTQLQAWLQEGNAPRGLLMNLLTLDAEWRAWKKQEAGPQKTHGIFRRYTKHTTLFIGPWQWHLTYQLARIAQRTQNEAFRRQMHQFVQSIIEGEIRTLGLSARWAELLLR